MGLKDEIKHLISAKQHNGKKLTREEAVEELKVFLQQ